MQDWRELRSASDRCRYGGGNPNDAVRFLRAAIEAAALSAPLEVPLLLNSLANLLVSIGDLKGAEDAARRSIEAERRCGVPIEESDSLGAYHSALAIALQKQGKNSEALSILDEAIGIFTLHVGEEENLLKNLRRLRLELMEELWRG